MALLNPPDILPEAMRFLVRALLAGPGSGTRPERAHQPGRSPRPDRGDGLDSRRRRGSVRRRPGRPAKAGGPSSPRHRSRAGYARPGQAERRPGRGAGQAGRRGGGLENAFRRQSGPHGPGAAGCGPPDGRLGRVTRDRGPHPGCGPAAYGRAAAAPVRHLRSRAPGAVAAVSPTGRRKPSARSARTTGRSRTRSNGSPCAAGRPISAWPGRWARDGLIPDASEALLRRLPDDGAGRLRRARIRRRGARPRCLSWTAARCKPVTTRFPKEIMRCFPADCPSRCSNSRRTDS